MGWMAGACVRMAAWKASRRALAVTVLSGGRRYPPECSLCEPDSDVACGARAGDGAARGGAWPGRQHAEAASPLSSARAM
eukprot:2083950-Rhodomonas_salina.2